MNFEFGADRVSEGLSEQHVQVGDALVDHAFSRESMSLLYSLRPSATVLGRDLSGVKLAVGVGVTLCYEHVDTGEPLVPVLLQNSVQARSADIKFSGHVLGLHFDSPNWYVVLV